MIRGMYPVCPFESMRIYNHGPRENNTVTMMPEAKGRRRVAFVLLAFGTDRLTLSDGDVCLGERFEVLSHDGPNARRIRSRMAVKETLDGPMTCHRRDGRRGRHRRITGRVGRRPIQYTLRHVARIVISGEDIHR